MRYKKSAFERSFLLSTSKLDNTQGALHREASLKPLLTTTTDKTSSVKDARAASCRLRPYNKRRSWSFPVGVSPMHRARTSAIQGQPFQSL